MSLEEQSQHLCSDLEKSQDSEFEISTELLDDPLADLKTAQAQVISWGVRYSTNPTNVGTRTNTFGAPNDSR